MRRTAWHRVGGAVALPLVFALASCRSTAPRSEPGARAVPAEIRRSHAAPVPLPPPGSSADAGVPLEERARRFLEAGTAEAGDFVPVGRELEWFGSVLNLAMRESRDVEGAVRRAAQIVVAPGREGDLCRAVEEVDHRVCCMRATFLAAALAGLAAGLGEHPEAAACADAGTMARLERLAAGGDPEVRAAASQLQADLGRALGASPPN